MKAFPLLFYVALLFLLVLSTSATALNISLVSPTLADGNVSGNGDNNWVYVNVSYTNTSNIHYNVLNWNGTNSTNAMNCTSGYHCWINKTSLVWGNYSFYVFLNTTAAGDANQTETRWNYLDICGNLNANRTLLGNVSRTRSTCITITAHNVALDCNGYYINGTDWSTTNGVIASNYNYTKISNCNVQDFYYGIQLANNWHSNVSYTKIISSDSYGLEVGGSIVRNLTVQNMTVDTFVTTGIDFYVGSFSTFTSINITSATGTGLSFTNGGNDTFTNVSITVGAAGAYAVYLRPGGYSNFSNCTFYSTSSTGIAARLDGSSYNNFSNVNFTSGSTALTYSSSGSNNSFYDSTFSTTTASLYTILFSGTTMANNNFTRCKITNAVASSSAYGVYSAGNGISANFFDSTINATNAKDLYVASGNDVFTFINVTYNKSSDITIAGTQQLKVKWYTDVHVVDNNSQDISGANVNISNTLNTTPQYETFNLTTNSTGWITRQNVQESMQNATATYNFTPHNIAASKTGYTANTTTGNDISGNQIFTIVLALTPPYAINILTPANDTWTVQHYLNVTGICNSSNIPFINASLNYNGTVQLNTSAITNGTVFYFNQSVVSDGFYYYNLTCYSSAGSNISETRLLKVDSTSPTTTWVSQNPADIDSFNAFAKVLNITYSITDVDGVNNSATRLWFSVNNSESAWAFENGTALEYWESPSEYQSNASSTFYFNNTDNHVYPATYNFEEHYVEATVKLTHALNNNNQFIKIQLLNVSNSKQYGFFEVYAANQSAASQSMRVYYCNSTYTTGAPATSQYCAQFYTLPASTVYNHTHTANSSHYTFPFAINLTTGKVGSVVVTNDSFFLLQGRPANGWNVYYISNVSRTDAIQTTVNNGVAWSNLSGTVDAHLHQFGGWDNYTYFVESCDWLGNCGNSTEIIDVLNLSGLPPSAPNIFAPLNATYAGVTYINWTAALSPNGYAISNYNVSLFYSNGTFGVALAPTTTNYSLVFDTTPYAADSYYIEVIATDNMSQNSTGESDFFSIDNNLPTIAINFPTNNSVWNASVPLYINGTAADPNLDSIYTNSTYYAAIDLTSPFNFTNSTMPEGNYSIMVFANDSANNTNSTYVNFIIDWTPPSISINAPTNGSNINASLGLAINITASDATSLDKAVTNDSSWIGTFSPTGDYFNITNTSDIVIGVHCVGITVNDSAGNANNAYVCFTTYGSYYSPYGVGIITPANNTWVAQKYLNITGICNSSTLPLVNASLNYNGTVQLNTSNILNATPFYFNVTAPADGWYYYYVSCYSASAVEATSPSQYLKVDTTPPSVTINAPANGSVYFNNDSLTINITAMDSGIGVDEAVTNSTYWTGTFSPTGDYFNITNTSSILGAIYCVQATVNDSLNWQNSAYSCFTITDVTNVSVSFIPPTPMTTSISQPWAFINVSYTNATSLHSIVLNWNGTNETNTMTCNYAEQYCYINKTGLATGNYTFYVYLNLTTGAYYQTGDNWVYAELCGNINTNTTLHSDINASGTCFVVTAPNVILNCNGYDLVGSGAGYGVYSTQENTTVDNCGITNFYSAITLKNTGGIAQITNNTLTNNWLGIELNSSSNGIIAGNYLAGNGGEDIVSTTSANNLLPNSFAGTLAAFNYYSNDIKFKSIASPATLNSFANGSSYIQINNTNASAWVLMNISYISGMTPSSVGLYEYDMFVWTGLGATHYTNATPQYFLLNTSSFSTYVVLGCPPAKPFYYGGSCYAYMSMFVATIPQYYKIGDVVTIFATLSDPTAIASQVILYYANLGGTGYLQQSFTYDPINAQWVGAFKLRQHSEYLQVMALNATGGVIGYGEFYLTENKSPTWWDYFLWLLLALVILVVLVFVGKWIYEAV